MDNLMGNLPVPFAVPMEIFKACLDAVTHRKETEDDINDILNNAPKAKPWKFKVKRLGRKKAQKKLRELVYRYMWPSIDVNLVTLNENGCMTLGSVTVDGTPMNRKLDIGIGTDLSGLSHVRYTEDMIKVRLVKPDSRGEDRNVDMSVFLDDSFVLTIIDGVRHIFRVHEGDVFGCDGKQLSDEESKQVMTSAYRCFNFGPSQSDTTAGDRKKWQYSVLADWPVDIPRAKAALTMGMSRLLVTAADKGAIAKASTRMTQYMANACSAGKLLCYAIYMGKFPFGDGQGYVTEELIARVLSSLSGGRYATELGSVLGLAIQSRPVGSKSDQISVTQNWVIQLIEYALMEGSRLTGEDEPIILVRSKVTAYDLMRYVMAFHGVGPWVGRTIVVCETEAIARNWKQHIEAVFDLNAIKAPCDLGLPAIFPIMDVSHACEDIQHGFSLSTQCLEKLTVADAEAAQKLVALSLRREFLEMRNRWLEGARETISSDDLADSRTLLEKIAPSARKYIRPMFNGKINEILKAVNSALGQNSKVGLTVHGEYRKMVSDLMYEVTKTRILKMENGVAECILPGMEEGTEAMAIRYPSSGYWSYIRLIAISKDEYIRRCREAGISEDKIAEIDKTLSNLNEGVVMVPASKALCSTLDGADFDGDAVLVAYCAKTCDKFMALKLEDINEIEDLDEINELLLQGIKYFHDLIDPIDMDVPEF